MTLPPLTTRGFWTRVVLLGASLLAVLWAVLIMMQEHSRIGVVLLLLPTILSLTQLFMTISRRPR